MQKLTKAEEQLMQVVWTLGKAFLREIMEEVHKTFPPIKEESPPSRVPFPPC